MLEPNRTAQTGRVNGWGALIGGATPGTVHLYMNNVALTPDTPLTALMEATFTGYAAVAIPGLSPPYIDPVSNQEVISIGSATFIAGAGMTPQTIYGAYVLDHAGVLQGFEALPAPVLLTEAGDGLTYNGVIGSGS